MNKYVVAYINFLDGDLKQELIEANDAREAVKNSTFGIDCFVQDASISYEECVAHAFDADCLFSVIKVS